MKKISKLSLTTLLIVALLTGCAKKDSAKASTFEGVAKGFGGDLKVAVTVEGDKIKDIKVLESKETPEYGGKAIEQLIKTVIEKQSIKVDAVSGATGSSKTFIEAVTKALTNGKVDISKFSK